jgi:hypothetical protein
MVVAAETNRCNSSSRFGPSSVFKLVAPVRLPPGRLRLATRLNSTGSLPIEKTIGIVVVAAFAASAAGPVAGTDSELDAVGNTGGLLGVRV